MSFWSFAKKATGYAKNSFITGFDPITNYVVQKVTKNKSDPISKVANDLTSGDWKKSLSYGASALGVMGASNYFDDSPYDSVGESKYHGTDSDQGLPTPGGSNMASNNRDWLDYFNAFAPLTAQLAGQGFNAYSVNQANKVNQQNNQVNQNMTQQQFDYQKQLNQNAIQWQSDDARKAGINPIAAMGAGSASGFSGTAGNQPMQSQNVDLSALANMSIAMAQIKSNEHIAQLQADSALRVTQEQNKASFYSSNVGREIAQLNNATSKIIADNQAQIQKYIAELNSETQKQISKITVETQKYIADLQSKTADKDRASRESVDMYNRALTRLGMNIQDKQFHEQLDLMHKQYQLLVRAEDRQDMQAKHEIIQGYIKNATDILDSVSNFLPTKINVESSTSTSHYDAKGRYTGGSKTNSYSSSRRGH